MILLDASAVLGYLNDEPGRELVESVLLEAQAGISVVNQTEVLSKLCDWGMAWEDAVAALGKLAMKLEPFAAETALEAARLRPLTREHGLSLGGRACLATARLRNSRVITGDRARLQVAESLGIEITVFRPSTQ